MSGIGSFSLGEISMVAPWMESLLWTSMEASLMAVVVLALQPLLRRHVPARWRFGLWLLVLVRFVPLPLPESSFSLYNWLPRQRAAVVEAPVADKGEPRAAVSEVPMGVVQQTVPRPPVVEKVIVDPAPTVAPMNVRAVAVERTKPFAWSRLIGCIYFVGAGVVLARLIFSTVALRRIVRGAVVLGDADVRIALLGVCRAMKVRNAPEVLLTDAISSPALVGILNPRLLVPRSVVERLTINELRLVFLHEIAHLRRRDVLTNYGVAGVALVHWFNPLLWLVLPLIRADRELACDELVLMHTGEPAVYGHTLLKLLEGAPKAGSLAPAVGILESRSFFSRRIAMIAGFKKRSAWRLIPAGTALGLVAACAMTAPSTNAAAPDGLAKAPATAPEASSAARPTTAGELATSNIYQAGLQAELDKLVVKPNKSAAERSRQALVEEEIARLAAAEARRRSLRPPPKGSTSVQAVISELEVSRYVLEQQRGATILQKGSPETLASVDSHIKSLDARLVAIQQKPALEASDTALNMNIDSGRTVAAPPAIDDTKKTNVAPSPVRRILTSDANGSQLLNLRLQLDALEQEKAAAIAKRSPLVELASLEARISTVKEQVVEVQERMKRESDNAANKLVPDTFSQNVAEFIRSDALFRNLENTKFALQQESAALTARRATLTEMASLDARSRKVDEQIADLRKELTREYNDAARTRAVQSVSASQGGELKTPEQIALTDVKMRDLLEDVERQRRALASVAGLGDSHRDVIAIKNALAGAEASLQRYADEYREFKKPNVPANMVMRVYDVHDILDVPDDQKSSLTSDQRNAMKDLADTLGHTALDTNAVLSSFNGMLIVNASDEVHTKVGKVLQDIRMAHQRRANELRDKMEKVKSEVR